MQHTTNDNSAFENGKQIYWDSTSLKRAMTCPKLYEYEAMASLTPHENSIHLRFGILWATTIENYYTRLQSGEPRESAVHAIVTNLLEKGLVPDPDKDNKTIGTLIRSFVWYAEHFADQDLKVLVQPSGEIYSEYHFKLPFPEREGMFLTGHLDLVAELADGIYIIDQKTTGSQFTNQYTANFSPDVQMSMYNWAGRQLFGDDFRGVMIDAMQVQKTMTRFHRFPVNRTAAQIEEFLKDISLVVDEVHRYNDMAYYPMRTESCNKYMGCPFRKICSEPPVMRPTLLEMEFTVGDAWNPSKERLG